MTNREAIFIVKRLFREVNADAKLPNKAIFSLLNKHRKWLIYKESERLKLIKVHKIYQVIECMEVIEVDMIDCIFPFKIKGNSIYRTKDKLPEIFEDSSGPIFGGITSIDDSLKVEYTTFAASHRASSNPWLKKYADNKTYVYYEEGYLYFPGKHIEKIEVEALFTEELDLQDYCRPCNDCENNCKRYLDKMFIIPAYLEGQLMDAVIKDMSNTYKRFPERSEEINKIDK